MAITAEIDVLAAALWPQGDIRDPLGVWGFRLGVTGDVSGGTIKVTAAAPAGLAAAYVYTCYSLQAVQTSGTATASDLKTRLLTNWPNIGTIPGVQGYATALRSQINGATDFTAPIVVPTLTIVKEIERFILLFDPRPSAGRLDIIELELAININLATYSFEGYGYFWDRSVLQAPGGPRHPGAS